MKKKLLHAVLDNNLEKLIRLIGLQSISKFRKIGYFLLCTACKKGYTEIVEYLLSVGCNVNRKYIHSRRATPLHFAVKRGNFKIIEMLLHKGACYNTVDKFNNTPVHYAACNSSFLLSIYEYIYRRSSPQKIIELFNSALKNKECSVNVLRILFKYGASVNTPVMDINKGNMQPIQFVASLGKIDIFLFLLAKGADINVIGSNGETLLHISAENGHLLIVEYLVQQGAFVNCYTFPTYDVMLKYSYNPDQTTPSDMRNDGNSELGFTPLHLAVLNNKYDVVQFLLDHGANIDAEEKNGKTAIFIAVERDYYSIVELLLSYLPCIDENDLIAAVISKNDSKIVKRLLNYCFSIDSEFGKNQELLFSVVENRKLTILEELIKHGADINTTRDGFSLLHIAVIKKYKDICEILLSNKADVNFRDSEKMSPLFYAVDNKEICKLLINYGANVNFKDRHNATPIVNPIKNADFDIIELLLKNGATITGNILELFNKAIKRGYLQFIEFILEHDKNFNVNAFDSNGRTPLHYTALIIEDELLWDSLYYFKLDMNVKWSNVEKYEYYNNDNNRNSIAKLLLTKGADVNSKTKMHELRRGYTPLFAAAKNGFKKVVQTLLEHNAEINDLKFEEFPPLHAAIKQSHVEVVDILIKSLSFKLNPSNSLVALNFASDDEIFEMLVQSYFVVGCKNTTNNDALFEFINSKDRNGLTPLLIAARKGFVNSVETLLSLGADVNAKDCNDETVLHIASKMGRPELIKLLLKFGCQVNLTSKDGISPLWYAEMGADAIRGQVTANFYCPGSRYNYRVIDYVINSWESACRILKNHIRKLDAVNLYLSDYSLDVDQIDETLKDGYVSYSDCYNELNMAKKYLIVGNISYYDLVTKSIDQLAMYARNKIVLQSFNSCECEKLFPVYSDLIHSRFRMGIKRNDILKESGRFLCSVGSNLSNLPFSCIEMILTNLSDIQLKSVIAACKPLKVVV